MTKKDKDKDKDKDKKLKMAIKSTVLGQQQTQHGIDVFIELVDDDTNQKTTKIVYFKNQVDIDLGLTLRITKISNNFLDKIQEKRIVPVEEKYDEIDKFFEINLSMTKAEYEEIKNKLNDAAIVAKKV